MSLIEGERGYLELARCLVAKAKRQPARMDRTGTGTWSLFGPDLVFDLSRGFPLLTTKRVWFKGVLAELLWFLSGTTNIAPLVEQGVHIWDAWADEFGALGPIYGAQWRTWGGRDVDQVADLVSNIQANGFSRRMVVSAWNAEDLGKMALPPCHILWQVQEGDEGELHMKVYQRSADVFLGLPFNIASYAALLSWLAAHTGKRPGRLHMSLGDAHLYTNHLAPMSVQLMREPRPLPTLSVDGRALDDLTLDCFTLSGYDPHPPLRGEVSV